MKYDCVSHMRRCAVYCGMSLRWNMYFGRFCYNSSNIFVRDLALKIYYMSYDEQLNMLRNIICSSLLGSHAIQTTKDWVINYVTRTTSRKNMLALQEFWVLDLSMKLMDGWMCREAMNFKLKRFFSVPFTNVSSETFTLKFLWWLYYAKTLMRFIPCLSYNP